MPPVVLLETENRPLVPEADLSTHRKGCCQCFIWLTKSLVPCECTSYQRPDYCGLNKHSPSGSSPQSA
ncbi:hypothetical protein IEO21_10591 [Rhodonia placenta]|uniref:Uncharacterized protein n=1 Tax=Rhodonia placenta TaxID=104341 RepID=A0A8H7NS80_9APHY|nr:hypothetical protein IEO21_10591 [Postia placenta]